MNLNNNDELQLEGFNESSMYDMDFLEGLSESYLQVNQGMLPTLEKELIVNDENAEQEQEEINKHNILLINDNFAYQNAGQTRCLYKNIPNTMSFPSLNDYDDKNKSYEANPDITNFLKNHSHLTEAFKPTSEEFNDPEVKWAPCGFKDDHVDMDIELPLCDLEENKEDSFHAGEQEQEQSFKHNISCDVYKDAVQNIPFDNNITNAMSFSSPNHYDYNKKTYEDDRNPTNFSSKQSFANHVDEPVEIFNEVEMKLVASDFNQDHENKFPPENPPQITSKISSPQQLLTQEVELHDDLIASECLSIGNEMSPEKFKKGKLYDLTKEFSGSFPSYNYNQMIKIDFKKETPFVLHKILEANNLDVCLKISIENFHKKNYPDKSAEDLDRSWKKTCQLLEIAVMLKKPKKKKRMN